MGTRFWLATALVALGGTACDGTNVPDPPTPAIGPAANSTFRPPEEGSPAGLNPAGDMAQATSEFCNKLVSCGFMDGSQMSFCEAEMRGLMALLIDPAEFSACLNATSCKDLDDDDVLELLEDCMDVDEESFSCQGDQFVYCNKSGTCKQLSCSQLCQAAGLAGSTCIDVGGMSVCDCMVAEEDDFNTGDGFPDSRRGEAS